MKTLILVGLGLALGLSACKTTSLTESEARSARAKGLAAVRATYCAAPRKADGRVNVDKLISELVDLRADTYSFCIHQYATDWDDLKLLLPAARAKGIRVWASVVPPTESYPRTKTYAEPFRLDFVRWGKEFAKLSLQHPNLVAWSIDDFTHNLKQTYTPAYVKEMLDTQRAVNPRLAFVPCCYFPAINSSFATNYASMLDGILFPYRNESGGANLTNSSHVISELQTLKSRLGPNVTVVLDIYATAHSRLGATTPAYVDEAMRAGQQAADGVMIYCHQDPRVNAEKYQVIKKNFSQVAGANR